jgi:Raf kinase inhibitor-like YbhB/YbcL family protein
MSLLSLLTLSIVPISCTEKEVILNLESKAFENNTTIPVTFTCDGADISPALSWTHSPDNTKSFALICEDPDAPGGTFVHWVIFNIPESSTGLNENVPHQRKLEDGTLQGLNDFGEIGYRGPCPPPGEPHHYRFTLYALDCMLDAPSGAIKSQLVNAMQGHILEQAVLIGIYVR